MSWRFRSSEDIFPDLVDGETTAEEESEVVETEYTGCAWCGDGDGEGICSDCSARMLAQSAARHVGR